MDSMEKLKRSKQFVLIGLAAMILLGCLMHWLWQKEQPAAQGGEKEIVVQVTHSDGTEKEFTYHTDKEYLGDLLQQEGLISGTEGEYGLFVDTVDGETAVYEKDGGWWRLICNGEDAATGADGVVLENGGSYDWIYTVD